MTVAQGIVRQSFMGLSKIADARSNPYARGVSIVMSGQASGDAGPADERN